MKNLEYLYHRAQTAILAPHYQAFLEPPDREAIFKAQQKKSIYDFLNLLKAIALKAIRKLKHSPHFWGETKWHKSFALYESQLQDPKFSIYQQCMVLCNVDDMLTIAYVLQAVRKDIWEAAQRQGVLSQESEQKYDQAQQQFLERRESLIALENRVMQIGQNYSSFTGLSYNTDHPKDTIITESKPRELPNYHRPALQTRFSESNIHHLVETEGDARIVYQGLARDMSRPSIAETLNHEIKLGQQRLNTKAQKILNVAHNIDDKIQKDSQRLIEQRTQIMIAHANRIENLILSLQKIIQILDHYLSKLPKNKNSFSQKEDQTLTQLNQEAKSAQDHLQESPGNIDAQQIQTHILTMEKYRKDYTNTLTGWGSLFQIKSKNTSCHENINQILKSSIAELIVPACGLQDHQGITTVDQFKKQQIYRQQLSIQIDQAHAESKKIQELSHDLTKKDCQP